MIIEFQNEYRWLSNFAPVSIVLEGVRYASVEHAYMSAKSEDSDWKKFCSNPNNTPGKVKKQSRNIRLRKDWEDIKVPTMLLCLRQKFAQEPYRTKLIQTGGVQIQEGNRWGDTFWGVCLRTGKGKNVLGTLIMSVREELQSNLKN